MELCCLNCDSASLTLDVVIRLVDSVRVEKKFNGEPSF